MGANGEKAALAGRVFRVVLRLHPRAFRERYEADLVESYREGSRAAFRAGGLAGRWFYTLRAFVDVGRTALRQRRENPWRNSATREARPGGADAWGRDARHAARRLIHQPGFSLVVILTLGLGLGANTAVFSIMHAVLVAPLPYQAPDRLVRIYATYRDAPGERQYMAAPSTLELRRSARTLSGLALIENYAASGVDITDGDRPERARLLRVSADYFEVLRTSPMLGRAFRRVDESDESGVAIVSEGVWRRHLGSRPLTLGATLSLDGVSRTIVGVMGDGFEDPLEGPIDVWLPSDTQRAADYSWDNHYLSVVGRIAPGVTVSQVRAELELLAERHWAMDDEADDLYLVVPLKTDVVGPADELLKALMGAVGFLLLLTCVNVAGLMLTQTASRARELAVRAALGSGRRALVRQLVLEAGLLSVAGGVAGVALGRAALDGLLAIAPAELPRRGSVQLGPEAIVLAAFLAVLVGLAIGALVALSHARPDIARALAGRSGSGSDTPRARRTQGVLVVSEVALAMVLLTGAFILTKSFNQLRAVDLGIDARMVTTFQINLPASRYPDGRSRQQFYDLFKTRVRTLSGVDAVGAASFLPASGVFNSWGTRLANGIDQPIDMPNVQSDQRVIDGDYFDALGIELVRGRGFDQRDTPDAPRRVVVSDSLARRLFPGDDPVGKFLRVAGFYPQIIGVVEDVPVSVRGDLVPKVYHRHAQFADNRNWRMNQIVRAQTHRGELIGLLRDALHAIDPELVLHLPRPMMSVIGRGVAAERFAMVLLGAFALLAVLLASLGLYGILSRTVIQKRREIGVRIALGARPSRIRRMVVARGITLAVAGSLLGCALSLPLLGTLRSFLFGVAPRDPAAVVVALLVFVVVSAVASYLPARAATRVDPMESFRLD